MASSERGTVASKARGKANDTEGKAKMQAREKARKRASLRTKTSNNATKPQQQQKQSTRPTEFHQELTGWRGLLQQQMLDTNMQIEMQGLGR